jgi:hypothetical protein
MLPRMPNLNTVSGVAEYRTNSQRGACGQSIHRRRHRTAITDMSCALGVLTLSFEICVSKLSRLFRDAVGEHSY